MKPAEELRVWHLIAIAASCVVAIVSLTVGATSWIDGRIDRYINYPWLEDRGAVLEQLELQTEVSQTLSLNVQKLNIVLDILQRDVEKLEIRIQQLHKNQP